ncbi:DDX27 [Lepeophtheirus salmonis]|uniref:DDX27 n=1 Tax=Lepeophtheirus salmonis TaxID=72036 RepID=A0A7R8D611_LEPSM|nr:DDX27 [Lepeophtheirus salmonis]CAF3039049.1 DDX27 [Lepeophtheirus salmonis]
MELDDLIKTIEDGEEVENHSETDESDDEPVPIKKICKKEAEEQGWNYYWRKGRTHGKDLMAKYVKKKRRNRTSVSERISNIRKERQEEKGYENESDKEESMKSNKENWNERIVKRLRKVHSLLAFIWETEDVFFEEPPSYDENASFYAMNLSRPLLKAIESLRYCPTRELGVQVYQVSKQLSQFTSIDIALSVGGLDLKAQELALRKNPDIVIATPGRLIDHIKNTPTFGLENIEVLILDEADQTNTFVFSATMTDKVNDLSTMALRKPVKIFVDSNKVVAWNLRQEFVRIRANRESDREGILAALVCRTFRDHTIVFYSDQSSMPSLTHSSESSGSAREIDVLITTDVAARGLDISGVKTVINYTLPTTLEHYIHRVGRTARAGRAGRSVSIAGEGDRKMVREIVKNARDPVKARTVPQDIISKYVQKLESVQNVVPDTRTEKAEKRKIKEGKDDAKTVSNKKKKLQGAREELNEQDRESKQLRKEMEFQTREAKEKPQNKKGS